MQHQHIAVMAESPVDGWLTAWLREWGFRPHAGRNDIRTPVGDLDAPADGAAPVAPSAPSALVTYLPGTAAQVVTEDVLSLMRPHLWLNLTPMPVEHAMDLADRASDAGVSDFVHAPYLGVPEPGTRPLCLVHAHRDDFIASQRGPVHTLADELLQALSPFSQWTGRPLAAELFATLLEDELNGLADYALGRPPTQRTS